MAPTPLGQARVDSRMIGSGSAQKPGRDSAAGYPPKPRTC
jgi:hypothetical protein